MDAEKGCKYPYPAALLELKMKMIRKTIIDLLKLLDACGSVEFDLNTNEQICGLGSPSRIHIGVKSKERGMCNT